MNSIIKKVLLCTVGAAFMLNLSACQAAETKKEVIPVNGASTSTAVTKPTASSVPSNGSAPTSQAAPTQIVEPVKADQLKVSSTYSKIIKDYQASLLRVGPAATLPEAEQLKLMNNLKKMVAQKSPSSKIFQSFEASITKLSPSNANKLAELAIKGLNQNLSKDNQGIEKLSSDSKFMTAYFNEVDKVDRQFGVLVAHPQNIKNTSVKNMIMKAKTMGYSVSSSEGMIYYLTDYASFAKYSACYTPDFANLIDDLAFDTLDPMTSDAALVISLDNLAARSLHLESGMKAGGGSKYQKYQGVRYISNMMYLFYGANNTPNFDYDTNRISEAGIQAFKKISEEKNTQTGKATLKFMKAIEGNKGIINDKLNKEGDKIINELKTYYGVTDQVEKEYNQWMMGE